MRRRGLPLLAALAVLAVVLVFAFRAGRRSISVRTNAARTEEPDPEPAPQEPDAAAESSRGPWTSRLLSFLNSDTPARPKRRGPPKFSLAVVDASSGKPLDDIAVRIEDRNRTSGPYPFELPDEVVRAERSPVELLRADLSYYVRAKGYAWELVTGNQIARRARVGLLRSGSLELTLENLPRRDANPDYADVPRIQLSWEDRDLFVWTQRQLQMEHVPAGPCRIQVWTNRPYHRRVLGEARVTVPVDGLARATIRLADTTPKAYPLGGTVDVPAGGWSMILRPIGGNDRGADAIGRRWSAGNVPAGRYVVELQPFAIATLVEVKPPGREDVVLRVPELADVVVHAVDPHGAPVRDADLVWHCVPQPGTPIPTRQPAWKGRQPDEYFFRAPQTTIEVGPGGPATAFAPQRFALRPGRNDVRIVVTRRPVLRIRFRANGRSRGAPAGFRLLGAPLAERIATDRPPKAVHYGFAAPGRYRLTFDLPASFAPIPPRDLDLDVGVLETVLDLEPPRAQ